MRHTVDVGGILKQTTRSWQRPSAALRIVQLLRHVSFNSAASAVGAGRGRSFRLLGLQGNSGLGQRLGAVIQQVQHAEGSGGLNAADTGGHAGLAQNLEAAQFVRCWSHGCRRRTRCSSRQRRQRGRYAAVLLAEQRHSAQLLGFLDGQVLDGDRQSLVRSSR